MSGLKRTPIIELLDRMENQGELSTLYRAGLIGHHVRIWRDVYIMVDNELRTGCPKYVAMQYVADKLGISFKYVEKIVRKMQRINPPTNQ